MRRRLQASPLQAAAVMAMVFALALVGPAATAQTGGAAEGSAIIKAIEFYPTQYLTEEEMRAAMVETKVGEPLDTQKLLADMQRIVDLGVEKHGENVFFDFEAEFVPDGDGIKVVIYPIERPTVAGFAVDIDQVDEATFFKYFDLKPGGLLDVDALYEAIYRAQEALYNETGYDFYLTGLDIDEQNVIHIQLRAAERPTVAGFEVDIDLVDESVFFKHFDVAPGTPLDRNTLNDALTKALEGLREETGYFYRVTGLEMDQENIVHIQLRAVRIASISVSGNNKTRDYVILREVNSKAGEPLHRGTLEGDLWRILHLGHFESVTPHIAERPDDPGAVDLTFEVVERMTGTAGFGIGYSSADGFGGYLEIADQNLFGRGQSASLRWELASRKSSYDLSFYEPNVAGSRISAGFSLYNTTLLQQRDRDGREYSNHSVGGQVSVGKRFTDFLHAFVTLRVNDAVKHYAATEKTPEETVADRTRSIRLSLSGDTTDYVHYPTSGVRFTLATELARTFWGGDTHFTKYEAQWSTYHKVGSNDQVLALRLMGGFAREPLPAQELFRAGGADRVRSYDYSALLGEKMLVGNAEYRFKISDNVQGVVFADVGNAWDKDASVSLSDLKSAVGIGIRFETPLGLMRLDYGIGANGGRAFFSIGPSF